MHGLRDLHIVVISDDGWSWALAWAQLGVWSIRCVPLVELAAQQLSLLDTHLPQHTVVICRVDELENLCQVDLEEQPLVVCGHATSAVMEEALTRLPDQAKVLMTASYHRPARTGPSSGPPKHRVTLKHRQLGGLTTARLEAHWWGPDDALELVRPGERRAPTRPLGAFLEPAVRLTSWRSRRADTVCWKPLSEGAAPYPWPLPQEDVWVEAPSVFLHGATMERPLTLKEKCQLVDLRADWGVSLLDELWKWNVGEVPPLRLVVEFILAASPWLTLGARNEEIEFDWSRERAPWLGELSATIPGTALEWMAYYGWIWGEEDAKEVTVATRSDDAAVDYALWAVGGTGPGMESCRESLRGGLHRLWRRRFTKEAYDWLHVHGRPEDASKDRKAIVDCTTRAANSSWWDWKDGSRLFFWRWPEAWRAEARDGAAGFHTKHLRPQRGRSTFPSKEEWIIAKDQEKLEKLLRRRYLVQGHVQNTVPRFPVPKGLNDIRVVWDLLKNGLNACMFTPRFFLPTMAAYLRRIEAGIYSGDFDIGEQFHNYMLHESEQVYCGVEIPDKLVERLRKECLPVQKFMRWGRLVFGWQSSPYFGLRMFARAIELAKGSPVEGEGAFGWTRVVLNLPGMDNYDPGRPRVMKQLDSGDLAADVIVYFDDGRVFGSTEALTQKAMRQITANLQHLGNQDAARKRREISQRTGAWAGGIAHTDQAVARTFISQEKWDRAIAFMEWVADHIRRKVGMNRKKYRSGKSFLVHLSSTYDWMKSYLKGFHLAEEAWRPGRDEEGWKVDEEEDKDLDEEAETDEEFSAALEAYTGSAFEVMGLLKPATGSEDEAPDLVMPVPQLERDLAVLQRFFAGKTPVQVIVRPSQGVLSVAYAAGDASGEGYGSRSKPVGQAPLIRRGFWFSDASDNSSNWRELKNLLEGMREDGRRGRLVGKEVWLFTDNSTAETAFYKGTSSSPELHYMVVELRALSIECNFTLRIVHIAGTRMIQIGVDGLSRGEMQLGALEDKIFNQIPLHLSPMERSPSLQNWLASWLGTEDDAFSVAAPTDWFHAAQQAGETSLPQITKTWVWDLPPAAAIHALEELGVARLKRHDVLRGVVLVPCLMRPEWYRRFARIVDVYFIVPAGAIPEWPANMHEALTIGLYLPLLRHQPWDWKTVPFMVPFGVAVSKMYKEDESQTGSVLRQFWQACTGVTSLPRRVVCDLLQSPYWRRFLNISTHRRRRERAAGAG